MKKANKKSSKKEKVQIIPKKQSLESEIRKNKIIEIKPDKKEISQEEFIDDEFDDDIEIGFQEDFSRILITGKSHDNIAVQSPLESGVIFAPRLKDRESKGKIYSSNKYDKKYTEHKYNEETPGVYSEKKGSKENSKEDNK
ncbi:MAG: hypothetical protein WAU65_02875 [Candidatus Nanoarchaeia archaeon]